MNTSSLNSLKTALEGGFKPLFKELSNATVKSMSSSVVATTTALAETMKVMDGTTIPVKPSLQPEAEVAKALGGKMSYYQALATRIQSLPKVVEANKKSLDNTKGMVSPKESPATLGKDHQDMANHMQALTNSELASMNSATGNIRYSAANGLSLDSAFRTQISSDGLVITQSPGVELHATGLSETFQCRTQWGHLSTSNIRSDVRTTETAIHHTHTDLTVASESQGLIAKESYRNTSQSISDTTINMRQDASVVDVRASTSASIRSSGTIAHQSRDGYSLVVGTPPASKDSPAFNPLQDALGGVQGYVRNISANGDESTFAASKSALIGNETRTITGSKVEVIKSEGITISQGLLAQISTATGMNIEGISGGVMKLTTSGFSFTMRGLLGDLAGGVIDQVMGCMKLPELPHIAPVDLPKALNIDLNQLLDIRCGTPTPPSTANGPAPQVPPKPSGYPQPIANESMGGSPSRSAQSTAGLSGGLGLNTNATKSNSGSPSTATPSAVPSVVAKVSGMFNAPLGIYLQEYQSPKRANPSLTNAPTKGLPPQPPISTKDGSVAVGFTLAETVQAVIGINDLSLITEATNQLQAALDKRIDLDILSVNLEALGLTQAQYRPLLYTDFHPVTALYQGGVEVGQVIRGIEQISGGLRDRIEAVLSQLSDPSPANITRALQASGVVLPDGISIDTRQQGDGSYHTVINAEAVMGQYLDQAESFLGSLLPLQQIDSVLSTLGVSGSLTGLLDKAASCLQDWLNLETAFDIAPVVLPQLDLNVPGTVGTLAAGLLSQQDLTPIAFKALQEWGLCTP